jgi:soluble P-type ATPase
VTGGEPGAETAVAVCVAAGDNVGFVHEAFANLACVELSQVVKFAS